MMKRSRYKQAQDWAERSLEISKTAKGYYILAKSFRLRGYFESAETTLAKLFQIAPGNASGLEELELIKRDKAREKIALKETYTKAFANSTDTESEASIVCYPKPPKQQPVVHIPEKFKIFCTKFLDDFKNSSETKILAPSDKVYTQDMLYHFACLAEDYHFDANMLTIDEQPVLEFKKL